MEIPELYGINLNHLSDVQPNDEFTKHKSSGCILFSSPCQRQCELLPSLKPLCQMNRNLVGSILGRSSIKIAQLVPIRQ